jgi:hypothetical protein
MTVADNKARRPSRFKYHGRSLEDVRQRIQFERFRETMLKAHGGELEPLHEYLRAFLPRDHPDKIIEWARRRLRRELLKRAPSPEREAEDLIISYVQHRLKSERQRLGGRPLSRGAYQRLIKQVCTDLAEDDLLVPADPARINYERILKCVRRGVKRKRPKA